MERFDKAFRGFQETGCFILEDAPVTLSQLRGLHDYIKRHITRFDTTVSCQFSLKDVEVIYRYTSLSSKRHKQVIHGALTDEERPQWGRPFNLEPWSEISCPTDTLPFQEQKQKLEEALLAVLAAFPSNWNSLKIEGIHFSDKKRLSEKFSSNLLNALWVNFNVSQTSKLAVLTLKDFTIDPIDLNVLIKVSRSLKALRLRSTLVDSYFLQDFLPSLYLHPSLEILEIFGHNLTSSDYSSLHKLFDNNYYIKQLLLENPSADVVTLEYHKNLLSRLSQGNEQRFKYEQLNQEKLVEMTEKAMVEKNSKQLDILLKQPNSLLSIRSGEEKTLSEVYEILPPVYCGYPTYMEKLWPQACLNLNAPFTDGKTAGEHLLEKAFEADDMESIKLLLKPGSGQLEKSKRLNSFLIKKLFEEKKASSFQGLIFNYFNQDLSTFSPWISQLLAHHLGIQSGINELKQHLDYYLKLLVDRISWSPLRKKILQVYKLLDDRKKEWELDFQNLIEGTQKAGEQELLYTSFRILDKHIEDIAARASEAKRGLLNRSQLHGQAYRISKTILQQIREYCDVISEDQRKEIVELKKYQAELQEVNINLQKKIDKKTEKHTQEKEDLKAEMETKRSQDKAEMEAIVKAQGVELREFRQMVNFLVAHSSHQPIATPLSNTANQKNSTANSCLFKP